MKINSVHVTGRRWFQRLYGNTYNTAVARVYVEGESVPRVLSIPFGYGYENQYLQRAEETLEAAGYMPGREHYANGGVEPAWQYFRARGVPFTFEATDVARKKDL